MSNKKNTVVNYDGKKIDLSEAVLLKNGQYAHKDEVVTINNSLYLKTDNSIAEDAVLGGWNKKTMMKAYASQLTKVGSKWVLSGSAYTRTVVPIVNLGEQGTFGVINVDVAKNAGLVEGLKSGLFYDPALAKDSQAKFLAFNAIKRKGTLGINKQAYYGISSPSYKFSEGKKYTFGLEIETSKGIFPAYLHSEHNVECEYDGSLKDDDGVAYGGEYITGVLTGDTGVDYLRRLCYELSRRCEVNNKCSVHVHLGGFKDNKVFAVALYKLGLILQNDLFSYQPPSRAKSIYCRPLERLKPFLKGINATSSSERKVEIDELYSALVQYVAYKKVFPDKYVNKKEPHPMGHKCGYNHSTQRYCWLNFVPLLFNSRGDGKTYTIEYRLNSGTTNFNKIYNWLKICIALTWYAETYSDTILSIKTDKSISLKEILKLAYPQTNIRLIRYLQERYKKFNSGSSKEAEDADYNDNDNEEIKSKKLKDLLES